MPALRTKGTDRLKQRELWHCRQWEAMCIRFSKENTSLAVLVSAESTHAVDADFV